MKVKLRDLKLEQFKDFNRVCNKKIYPHCVNCPLSGVQCSYSSSGCFIYHKDIYTEEFLNQEIEIRTKAPILNLKECKNFSELLRQLFGVPRWRVLFIKKIRILGINNKEYETLVLEGKELDGSDMTYQLPLFEVNKKYSGMKLNKKYTLEDLELEPGITL